MKNLIFHTILAMSVLLATSSQAAVIEAPEQNENWQTQHQPQILDFRQELALTLASIFSEHISENNLKLPVAGQTKKLGKTSKQTPAVKTATVPEPSSLLLLGIGLLALIWPASRKSGNVFRQITDPKSNA